MGKLFIPEVDMSLILGKYKDKKCMAMNCYILPKRKNRRKK
jgi:hypothetical protein